MKYYVKTYGCQMNYADSERIRTVFNNFGVEEVKDIKKADYIVLNSCAVRQKAEDKLLGQGRLIKRLKQKHKSQFDSSAKEGIYPIVILTGCMVKTGIKGRVKKKSVERIRNELLHNIDWLDYAVSIEKVFSLLEQILYERGNEKKNNELRDQSKTYLDIPSTPYSSFEASLPISYGCNHHCTFCTVPFSRGEENFRSYNEIKNEYSDYVKQEYKKITLLGQTVNKWLNPKYEYHPKAYSWYKYGEILPNALDSDGSEPDNFLNLLSDLDSVEGKYWLNFISSYPNYFTKDLIKYIVESIKSEDGHLVPNIHLAVQSGSNRVLADMYRHYSIEEFISIVRQFREKIPDISITTDIIVGYTTETEEDFQKSIELVRNMDFDMIYISEYSVRPDTPASELGDKVSKIEKTKRKKILNSIFEKNLIKRNKQFLNSTQEVLIQKRHKNKLIGRSRYGKDVMILNTKDINDFSRWYGKFIEVKITDTGAWGLKGKVKG
ncbi:MiaB/RimO family radical SAM methylthiotransferase [Candidatus Dojkabacteria bacterium]|nr:MiaB/RimO family radical SAM methylthiotransferase [Candidatus Dojkabacteria bacterium]